MRNKGLFLLFRVANMRSSHLLEAHVRAQLVQKVGHTSNHLLSIEQKNDEYLLILPDIQVTTDEGEIIHLHQEELKVSVLITILLWVTRPVYGNFLLQFDHFPPFRLELSYPVKKTEPCYSGLLL